LDESVTLDEGVTLDESVTLGESVKTLDKCKFGNILTSQFH
jgi:hypothetical protein